MNDDYPPSFATNPSTVGNPFFPVETAYSEVPECATEFLSYHESRWPQAAIVPQLAPACQAVQSHKEAVEAFVEAGQLCDHAKHRGFEHPGLDKYQQLIGAMRPGPHAVEFEVKSQMMNWVDTDDEEDIKVFQKRIKPTLKDMKKCEEILRSLLEDTDVKDFVSEEKKFVAREEDNWNVICGYNLMEPCKAHQLESLRQVLDRARIEEEEERALELAENDEVVPTVDMAHIKKGGQRALDRAHHDEDVPPLELGEADEEVPKER